MGSNAAEKTENVEVRETVDKLVALTSGEYWLLSLALNGMDELRAGHAL